MSSASSQQSRSHLTILDLVLGTPSIRRRFLDVLLSQIDRQYLRFLQRYAKILSQRNGLLRRVGNGDPVLPTPEQFAVLG